MVFAPLLDELIFLLVEGLLAVVADVLCPVVVDANFFVVLGWSLLV